MKYIIVMRNAKVGDGGSDWDVIKIFFDKKEAEGMISDQLKENNRHGFPYQYMIAKIVRRVEKDKSYFICVHGNRWQLIHMDIYPHNDTYQWPSIEAQKAIEKIRCSGEAFIIAEPVNFSVQVKISK